MWVVPTCLLLPIVCLALQGVINREQETIQGQALPDFTFSREWQVLGPFQTGTRETTWGADPLEFYGGFHSLEYSPNATFPSTLGFNGTTCWSTREAILSYEGNKRASADLSVTFPEIEWQWLRDTYGWAAVQWQAWARGGIFVRTDDVEVLILSTDRVLEYWIDDIHYYGGDFYGYRKVPVTLRLSKGAHRFEVKLVRGVRSMGGIGEPKVDIKLELQRSRPTLVRTNPKFDEGVLISDVIGDDYGPIASPYVAVTVRNDGDRDIVIYGIDGMQGYCILELISTTPIRLIPGQTRPIGFEVGCVTTYNKRINAELLYQVEGSDSEHRMHLGVWPDVLTTMHEPHRFTYVAPGGMVSYAVLRPPSPNADCGNLTDYSLPILIALHGAGLEADLDIVKGALNSLPHLCAWALFPTGVTPWSGDDWHVWGLADVEAAVAAIPRWIEQVEWKGPGVDINRWLISGHSNGGQGTWYVLTHRPDKIIGAAASSGYSSIQNYVPYVFWHVADPGREAVIQAALLNYRHELLLENAKDIPVIHQHGSEDRNVPVYNARLLAQRIRQAGVDDKFYEMPGKPHYWDGVMTSEPMSEFYNRILVVESTNGTGTPLNLRDFTMVLANAGEMGTKNGIKVLKMATPAKLAKLKFVFDPLTLTCLFRTTNVREWRIGSFIYDDCGTLVIDGQSVSIGEESLNGTQFERREGEWITVDTSRAPPSEKHHHNLGGMDAILRSKGHFSIVRHSQGVEQITLQISRNLCQYYAADTDITDFNTAINTTGNVISIAIRDDLPQDRDGSHPIFVDTDGVTVRFNGDAYRWSDKDTRDLAAAYLRPLPGDRLELVVWGIDARALEISARLVPMLTGGGQPDWVITGREMMWKGVEGTLGLGFFDSDWEVSQNSYLGV